MPNTLTGLVLFVVLLLPGFAYLVGKERHGTGRSTSAFRETASVVVASVVSELVVLITAAVAMAVTRTTGWPWVIDMDALVHTPEEYWQQHYWLLLGWGLALLVLAAAGAYAASWPRLRKLRILRRFTGPYPHPSTVSAWWMAFEEYKQGRDLRVGVILDNGRYFFGPLGSFNTAEDDVGDRDLVLMRTSNHPIRHRPPGREDEELDELDCGAVCISARYIVAVTVAYVDGSFTSRSSYPEKDAAPVLPDSAA